MAFNRFHLRSAHRLLCNVITCNNYCVPLYPAVCNGNLPDSGSVCWNTLHGRCYWNKKRTIPRAPPTKPLNFDTSGDSTHYLGKIDYSQPKIGFEGVPELESADEMVKKIFSLEYSTQHEVMETIMANLAEKVKDHPLDVKSLEVTIARQTVSIRNRIKCCLQHRKNKLMKMQLVGTMRSRSANLEKLQQIDIEKFNWLTKELQINIMPIVPPRLSKREIREKAARDAKDALIVQKTQELRKKLAKEKQKFDEYRQAELADIEQSLQELGIEMKSLEQTLSDLGASEHIPRLEPWVSLEQLLWQRKFAQLMELKKKTDAETLQNYGFIVPKSLLS